MAIDGVRGRGLPDAIVRQTRRASTPSEAGASAGASPTLYCHGWGYVVVDDLEAHHRRAAAAGAEIVKPPQQEGYGFFYGARDPEGNLWSFETYRPQTALIRDNGDRRRIQRRGLPAAELIAALVLASRAG